MIQEERIHSLKTIDDKHGDYIVYRMQQAQRLDYNHALVYAIVRANLNNLPLLVHFSITKYPEANLRHYHFMLTGLLELRKRLEILGIRMIIEVGDPIENTIRVCNTAQELITDKGYLRIQRHWTDEITQRVNCSVTEIESDVLVPIETVSQKQEYSAATIRRKIHRLFDRFNIDCPVLPTLQNQSKIKLPYQFKEYDTIQEYLDQLDLDDSVSISPFYLPSEKQAQLHLINFIDQGLKDYESKKNDPSLHGFSDMSPYLHFGQISSLYILRKIYESGISAESYIEELIIRRELAMNFVYFNKEYDSYSGLPLWSRKTLLAHQNDRRDAIYSIHELEAAQTHDKYWNSAQIEMVLTGKMHGYMRMYWGKKIIEWTNSPEEAYQFALYLNNKYELDGRDANGFTGVGWCFGLHDRPWKSRVIFGNVRYMNAKGLERKFNMEKYVNKGKSEIYR